MALLPGGATKQWLSLVLNVCYWHIADLLSGSLMSASGGKADIDNRCLPTRFMSTHALACLRWSKQLTLVSFGRDQQAVEPSLLVLVEALSLERVVEVGLVPDDFVPLLAPATPRRE